LTSGRVEMLVQSLLATKGVVTVIAFVYGLMDGRVEMLVQSLPTIKGPIATVTFEDESRRVQMLVKSLLAAK
jgi:hypothetical protein